jgi:uncharacterized protein with GYD domain
MESYVILMGMTEKGLKEIDKIPVFVDDLRMKMEKRGLKLKDFFKTMGETDYVAIFEAPNEKEALGVIMALGKIGYFTTLSMKAFTMMGMTESINLYVENYK